MGETQAKQFLDLGGRPLLAVTLESFQQSPAIGRIILIVPREEVDFCRRAVVRTYGLEKVETVVAGGSHRQESVRIGIECVGDGWDLVLIHDAARPMVSVELIERVVAAAGEHRAVTTGLPARDTIKEVDGHNVITKTCDRQKLWLIQTPQIFRYQDIVNAHSLALCQGWEDATDDACLVERMGIPVKVIEGSEENIKVTTPFDIALARFLLEKKQ
jgi:2-C-methyl-D-erythritol 4-phosphate cytidylyltransferase